jgi:hypothetical protein
VIGFLPGFYSNLKAFECQQLLRRMSLELDAPLSRQPILPMAWTIIDNPP